MKELRTTDKLIVTVATTGAFQGKEANPNLPLQPEEIGQSTYEAWNEGASIVHIHARERDTYKPTSDPEILNEIARTGDYSKLPAGSATVYSNVDPTCCPPGKSVVSTICFAEPEVFERVLDGGRKRGKAYKQLKKQVATQLLEKMGRALGVPDLESHAEVVELATPVTLKRYTNHRGGSFVGWRKTPDQGGFDAAMENGRMSAEQIEGTQMSQEFAAWKTFSYAVPGTALTYLFLRVARPRWLTLDGWLVLVILFLVWSVLIHLVLKKRSA